MVISTRCAYFTRLIVTLPVMSTPPLVTARHSLTKYAQRVEMTIANNHGWRTAFLVRLQLRGVGLDGRPGQQIEVTSTDPFWTHRTPRKLTTSGFYIQTYAQAKFLADFHIDRHEQPTMFHSITGLPGRPAMRLGHQVAISLDAGVITPNTRYAIPADSDASGFHRHGRSGCLV